MSKNYTDADKYKKFDFLKLEPWDREQHKTWLQIDQCMEMSFQFPPSA